MPHFWSFVDGEFRKLTFVRVLIRSHTPGSDKYVYDKSYRVDGPLATDYILYQMSHFAKFLSQIFDMHTRADASFLVSAIHAI